jgi:hypothetical protein
LPSGQPNDKISHFIAFAGFTFFWFFHSSKYGQLILIAVFYPKVFIEASTGMMLWRTQSGELLDCPFI